MNVVIFSQTGDAHVDLLAPRIRKVEGIVLTIINTDLFFANNLVSTQINLEKICQNLLVNSKVLVPTSIWYRRPASSFIKSSVIPEVAEYIRRETDLFWMSIFGSFNESTKWVNNPFDLTVASIKMRQLLAAKGLGFDIPATLITTNEADALEFCLRYSWDIIAKTLGSPVVKKEGVTKNTYARKLSSDKAEQLKHLAVCPVILQQYIKPKSEYRVTVIGDKVFAAELVHSTSQTDWRAVNPSELKIVATHLPEWIDTMCVALTKCFNLNFSTMDIILSEDNRYYFLDLNPNGQWLWVDLETKQGMAEYFVKFLCT